MDQRFNHILEKLNKPQSSYYGVDYDLKIRIKESQLRRLDRKGFEFWRGLHKKYATQALSTYSQDQDLNRLRDNPVICRILNHYQEGHTLNLTSYKKRDEAELKFKNTHSDSIEAKTEHTDPDKPHRFMIVSYQLTDVPNFKWGYLRLIKFEIDKLKKLQKRAGF